MPFLAIFSQPCASPCLLSALNIHASLHNPNYTNNCIGSGDERKALQAFLSTTLIVSALGATGLLVSFRGSCGRFSGGRNVLSAGALQDFLGPVDFFRGIAMDGKENSAPLQAPFITLRFIFGYSHPDQCAREAADGPADSNPRQGSHDWPCCDEGADAGNRKSADSGKQSQSPAQDCA